MNTRNTLHGPASVLERIPGFARATPLRRLTSGPVSDKWLVTRHGKDYVLRVDRPLAAVLGLDRFAETEMLATLARAGWQDPPEWTDPANGLLLSAFVPGVALQPVQLREPAVLRLLGQSLRALHALPPSGPRFDLASKVRRYAKSLGDLNAARDAEKLSRWLQKWDSRNSRVAICHNDPVAGNILRAGGAIRLIDWEYAAVGSPWFDLAAVVEHHELDGPALESFLEGYGTPRDGPDGGVEPYLTDWRQVYRIVTGLWGRVVADAKAQG